MSKPIYGKYKIKSFGEVRIPYDVCKKMTLKQIRKTPQYKKLSPYGLVQNISGTYKYGAKSSMRKEELCKTLDNPKEYMKKALKSKRDKKNMSKRKRSTRASQCLYPKARVPVDGKCRSTEFKHLGVMQNGKTKCCYKKKQSSKTKSKRLRRARK